MLIILIINDNNNINFIKNYYFNLRINILIINFNLYIKYIFSFLYNLHYK